MIGMLALGLGAIGVGLTVAKFIVDELTEEERVKQARMEEEFEDYKSSRQKDYEDILTNYHITSQEFCNSHDEEVVRLRNEYENKCLENTRRVISHIDSLVDEQLQAKLELKEEIERNIVRIKELRKTQGTMLRGEAINTLQRELEEARSKIFAYQNYLAGYKAYLKQFIRFNKEIDNNFKRFSFVLPKDYPYVGKLMFLDKNKLDEGLFTYKIEDIINVGYYFDEHNIIESMDEEANIPVLVTSSSFDKVNYRNQYDLSASKGYLKHIAINQSRIGIEAKVVEHRVEKYDKYVKQYILLDYKGIDLILNKRDLENPKRTPPCGSTVRVYPKKWDYSLRYDIEVSEKYQDSLKAFQFSSLPLVFDEEGADDFTTYIEENAISFDNDEWKVGPVDENHIPDVSSLKFQFGNELVFCGDIEEENNQPYIRFKKVLDKDLAFKPDEIFVVMEAVLDCVYEDDMDELPEEAYNNIKNLSIMFLNEFKLQKSIKNSHRGMSYFNKWAEITDKLINYLYKGKSILCEIEGIRFDKYDNKNNIPLYKANIVNTEEIRSFVNEVSNGFKTEFFVENHMGEYTMVEFSPTGEQLTILGNSGIDDDTILVNIYVKNFSYPEIQQKRALNDFRSGMLSNSKLQSYVLDSSNIESSKNEFKVLGFINERLASNNAQRTSVINAVEEKDIFLIQGPPGTGKTTVIREIINQHISRKPNDRILVVSQANVAIDNVLKGMDKILLDNMIRCGHEEKIDEDLKDISFEVKYREYINKVNSKVETDKNRDILRKWVEIVGKGNGKYNANVGELLLKKHSIIGATCVGLAQKQIGLDRLEFDLVVIDEVGKALPAEILLPLNRAKKVIMIGDHKQLPPTVHTALYDSDKVELDDREYCNDELFEKCLFENLYENCTDTNKSMLKTQYRMPAIIGTMISECFYDGELENGDSTYEKQPIYFEKNLNILDMSQDIEFKETENNGASVTNEKEAQVVCTIVKDIRENFGTDKRIAIISPYKGQKRVILKALRDSDINIFEENIAVNTIDAFQGDEAEIVLYCTTRSAKPTKYFSDLARLNVAFSRAKNELLIIGSLKYFKKYGKNHILYKIANYIENNGQVIDFVKSKYSGLKPKEIVEIDEIIIPDDFLLTPPKQWKIDEAIKYYNVNGKLDKPITVSNGLVIKNGYARYLAAKELGIDSIEIKVE